jgi:hypothetical protein
MKGPLGASRTRRALLIWVVAVVALLSSCYVRREFDKKAVLKTHFLVMELLVAGKSEEAYGLTTNDYRATHSLREFHDDFAHVKNDPLYLTKTPTILSCSFGSAEIFAWPHTGGMFEFLNGPSFYYRKENGEWRFTGDGSHYLD